MLSSAWSCISNVTAQPDMFSAHKKCRSSRSRLLSRISHRWSERQTTTATKPRRGEFTTQKPWASIWATSCVQRSAQWGLKNCIALGFSCKKVRSDVCYRIISIRCNIFLSLFELFAVRLAVLWAVSFRLSTNKHSSGSTRFCTHCKITVKSSGRDRWKVEMRLTCLVHITARSFSLAVTAQTMELAAARKC